MLGFEPIPSSSEPCCPTHCSMGTVRISEKIYILQKYGPTGIRTRTYCLRQFCPHRTAESNCSKLKIVGKSTQKKKTLLID